MYKMGDKKSAWRWKGRGKGWRDCARKLNKKGMSEMMDVGMKVATAKVYIEEWNSTM